MRPPPDPELVRRVVERRRRGDSLRVIAEDAGVCEATVRRWCAPLGREARPAPPPMMRPPPTPPPIMTQPPPAPSEDSEVALRTELEHLAAALDGEGAAQRARVVRRALDALATAPADDTIPDASEDLRGWLLAMIARTQRSYERAERAGNSQSAARYAGTLERWAARLKQYDAQHADDGDAITIRRSDIAERQRAVEDMLRAMTAEPLRCTDCGRRVRASWATGGHS